MHAQADVDAVSAAVIAVLNGVFIWLLVVSLLPALTGDLFTITLMQSVSMNVQSCNSSNSSSAKANL